MGGNCKKKKTAPLHTPQWLLETAWIASNPLTLAYNHDKSVLNKKLLLIHPKNSLTIMRWQQPWWSTREVLWTVHLPWRTAGGLLPWVTGETSFTTADVMIEYGACAEDATMLALGVNGHNQPIPRPCWPSATIGRTWRGVIDKQWGPGPRSQRWSIGEGLRQLLLQSVGYTQSPGMIKLWKIYFDIK